MPGPEVPARPGQLTLLRDPVRLAAGPDPRRNERIVLGALARRRRSRGASLAVLGLEIPAGPGQLTLLRNPAGLAASPDPGRGERIVLGALPR